MRCIHRLPGKGWLPQCLAQYYTHHSPSHACQLWQAGVAAQAGGVQGQAGSNALVHCAV